MTIGYPKTTLKEDLEGIIQTSKDVVTGNIRLAQEYARTAFIMANQAMTNLANTAKNINPINVSDVIDFEIIEGLKEWVEDTIQGDRPAFTEDVEEAIIRREHERAIQIQNDTIDRINAEWSRMRAPLPNGVLVAAIEEAELNFANKRLDASRDILLKNFELTQSNVHKAVDGYGILIQGVSARENLEIQAKQIEIKNLETQTALKTEALKGMAQIASSLAIGALSAIHVSAGIDAKGSASGGLDFNRSYSESYDYNYDMTKHIMSETEEK